MQMLQDAGIYVVSDLSEPATSINRNTPEWNTDLYQRYTDVVDALSKYNNVLGFFAGNEVSNSANNTVASAFVKAAVRDTKAYIARKKYRSIGVGYATNDDETRTELANYFNCGPQENAIDFWGYNIYSWCGKEATYESSHYGERTEEFSKYSVPAFFAEYGCIDKPRLFNEVDSLFGKNMTPVWSGGVVYMYFEEVNNYGKLTRCCACPSVRIDRSQALCPSAVTIKPLSWPTIQPIQVTSSRLSRPVSISRLTAPATALRHAPPTALVASGRPMIRFHPPRTSSSAVAWCRALIALPSQDSAMTLSVPTSTTSVIRIPVLIVEESMPTEQRVSMERTPCAALNNDYHGLSTSSISMRLRTIHRIRTLVILKALLRSRLLNRLIPARLSLAKLAACKVLVLLHLRLPELDPEAALRQAPRVLLAQ